ncbi:DUF3347 domain-containing protein [Chryseobacterium sp. G0186]|uniref:DUF3347 domain-containing protein n=1 Tax=Chryseobacterium sp. G0186 TaxID=2487064 RepID=UPI000F4E3C8F|nr:DUF3347 domain-containing protein [Chryseobacterium sp. G0186]AZA76667.1 DUF3347 domain-containing protein [Chryseobacterium sp. G0186]
MKNILTILLTGSILYSCNNPNSNSAKKEAAPTPNVADELATTPVEKAEDHSSVENKKEVAAPAIFSIKEIIEGYFPLKNALVKDDSKATAMEAKKLYAILKKNDPNTPAVKKDPELSDILDSAAENAEHISDNADDIAHQREHLLALSNDITDLIEKLGTGGLKLYQDFCPMYNDGKGGTWISESEEIFNPYEGKKMINCGSVKKVL